MIERYYAHKKIKYYEIANNLQPLVLIHAQGVDGKSYANVAKRLSKSFMFIRLIATVTAAADMPQLRRQNMITIGRSPLCRSI